MIGLLTTHFTGFFRHARHFELAAEHALWAAHRRGSARLWSAAAATGEEPYSLAMSLLEIFPGDDPPVSILATDVDAGALETARRGEYGEAAVATLAPERRARFLARPDGSRRFLVAPAVRRLVEFREVNLARPGEALSGPFDVVFCRNALMYLEEARRALAMERLASLIPPGGMLVLDPAEHLGAGSRWFGEGAGGVFRRRRESP